MKVAILNLPVDNNYGGMLQRYALMKALQDMGHEPIHLQTIFHWESPTTKEILKRVYHKIRYRQWNATILRERSLRKHYEKQNRGIRPFYERYIRHTPPIVSLSDFNKYQDFDAYIVGSDQSWRKSYCVFYPYETMYLSWLRNDKPKRITYGVSFGKDENELTLKDIEELAPLYKKFSHVSVRESSAIDLIHSYGWKGPIPVQVLDPTLFFDKDFYISLINASKTKPSQGNLFCYVLDQTEEVNCIIDNKVKEKGATPYFVHLKSQNIVSVEQWLRSFWDAEYIITDSFHGLVFATIFNKPFHLIRNQARGGARFDSLLSILYNGTTIDAPNWAIVNQNIAGWREISLNYLEESLK